MDAEPIDVLLVTRPECGFCDEVKDVLHRVARDHPLRVRTLEFESDEGRALALREGALFPPLVFLDGRFLSYGRLSERRLRREVAGRRATA